MNRAGVALRGLLVAVVFASATIGAHAQSEALQFPVVTKTLKNGMKVLVQTDHSIPNVALYIFYRIGSRNERPGTTGLSHFFEHMMFNGAKKYGPGALDKAMEASGAANNAYTTQNVTVYQDWFPRSALNLIFDIEADRIQNLSFDPKTKSSVRIGARNVIREHVTIHRGTTEGSATSMGDNNYLMAGAHLGHNCSIANKVIIANNCLLGGYVQVEDGAFRVPAS